MDKDEFKQQVISLVNEYTRSASYVPPVTKGKRLTWWFVGWTALSLGVHMSLRPFNFELHLPFGFIRFAPFGQDHTYYEVSIQC